MSGRLDWKWIAIGVVIMIGLNIAAGIIAMLVMGAQLESAAAAEQLSLSGGQMLFLAVLNFLAFLIGGFIVGLQSSGKTIIEPGLSAAIAVLFALLISGNFSVFGLVAGGVVPFAAGVLGGWLGERRQGNA
ncbi:MAG: hypothetical protein JNM48_03720 [Rhodospirillales bacterium]|nr:hypothetical protein [Rhodospirillales bacterium]